jgi:hypothetical protein
MMQAQAFMACVASIVTAFLTVTLPVVLVLEFLQKNLPLIVRLFGGAA